jgi:uroporphyrinogen decarboxylase
MPLTERENFLRAARFQSPEWIPAQVFISPTSWSHLREEAEAVCLRHPTLFPGFEAGRIDFDHMDFAPHQRAGVRYRDAWGCIWETHIDGLTGEVTEHPLADWSAFEGFEAPDPLTTNDHNEPPEWDKLAEQFAEARSGGTPVRGALPHGFFFMRLWYLRGFENLMLDIADGDERLDRLIGMVRHYGLARVEKWLSYEPDVMHFPEDLGGQSASIISPASFARWLTPVYRDLMQPCREAGVLVHMHSDGHITELADELAEAGVDIINPQDLCNGIDELRRTMKGRFAIHLDIDRQKIVPFGTRAEIRELIETEVRQLGSPEGGLMLVAGIYPPTPPENIDAVCSAIEEFRTCWSDGRGG